MAFKYLIYRLNGIESVSITHIELRKGQGDNYQKDLCNESTETTKLFCSAALLQRNLTVTELTVRSNTDSL